MSYKLVIVDWVDSQQSGGWQLLSDLRHDTIVVQSVGWIIYEDNNLIQITSHIGQESGGMSKQICGHMTIPKSSIMRCIPVEHDD